MAYIKKEPIIEFITKGLNNPDKAKAFGHDAIEILTEIEYSPTADVVPKSEYDEVLSNWQKIHDSYNSDCIEHYKYGRAEVAREIFEDFTKHKICTNEEDFRVLAELKKKYTEGA